jgi:hypothetical protein
MLIEDDGDQPQESSVGTDWGMMRDVISHVTWLKLTSPQFPLLFPPLDSQPDELVFPYVEDWYVF